MNNPRIEKAIYEIIQAPIDVSNLHAVNRFLRLARLRRVY